MERSRMIPKIYVVDDEDINLKFIHRILSKEYDVSSTNDSSKALDLIINFNPDLILLDVYMPILNGFDLAKRIVASSKLKNIPIIFISSLRDATHTKTGLEIGAVDFISKPLRKEEVLARIKTHIEISRLQKELKKSNSELEKLLKEKSNKLDQEKSEKRQINAALIESEKRFQSIFEQAPEAIIIVSVASGEIVDSNNASCQLFGYEYDELIGMNQMQLLQPSDEKIKTNYFKIHDESNRPKEIRMSLNTLITKAGKKIPVQNSSKTLLIEGELYLFGVIFDLRSRLQVEKELVKAKESAEKHNRLKSALLANISHELRTPLVGMLGFSNILEEELKDDKLQKMAKSITTSGKRLLNTLKVIMDFSTLESETYIPDYSIVNLKSMINSVVESFRESYEDKGLKVIVNLPEKEIYIKAVCSFITEVISHLLNNAITFTHFGSISISLEELKKGEKSCAIISIQDTGIGMTETKLETIFDEFTQISEGFSREYDGLGLGLTLVKKIIELHNGEIYVQSKEGEGSLFKVTLEIEKNTKTTELLENKSGIV